MGSPPAGKQQEATSTIGVLVAVFSVDRRAFGEAEAVSANCELQMAGRDQVHFDARQDVVPARLVSKGVQGNVAVELAIDPLDKVEVELGRDAFGVVVRGEQP